jgi:hypothetical protein
MAENNETPFSPLDSLGPEYGNINPPKLDELSYKPFEGDRIQMPEINFKASPVPNSDSLNIPHLNVHNTVTGIQPNKPGPKKGQSTKDIASALNDYSKAISQANQDKNAYSRIYAYNAGPSGNNFYKRYAAYGQEKFDEIGFSPLRDNESLFNERTTKWNDLTRMMQHSFLPLMWEGFKSGPKSLWKMAQGDFTSADLEDAETYENAAAIGQSTKGGVFGFVNNAAMNFGYTAGIISEILAEEGVALGITALTEGAAAPLLAGTTERNIARLGLAGARMTKYINKADDVFRGAVRGLESSDTARAFYRAANTKVGRVLNPFSNTLEAMNTVRKAGEFDNLTSLAKVSKTFGGFYRDVRNVNAALSEARLEAGMVENKVYQNLYDEFYKKNGFAPTNDQQYEMIKQSKQASLETLGWNTALIYATNKITFDNILNPKGGISKLLKNKTKEILNLGTGKVILKKTYEAGSKIAKGEFKYFENTIKGSIERIKEMGFKESIKDIASQTAKKSLTYFKGNISEGLQENAQETIAQAMEKYHTDAFDSKAVKAHLYSKGAAAMGMRDQSSYFAQAWSEQNPLTAQGFETFATGFVMGAFAGPMNKLPNWASTGYNRIFKPEQYSEYKKLREEYGKSVAKTLTDLYNDPKDFLDSKIFNLGNQEIYSKIKENGGRKESLDVYDQSFVDQVYTALRSGSLDTFKEHLASFKELTPEEFEGSMQGIPKGEGAKYQARIDSALSRADEIQKAYNEINERYPSPINLDDYEEGTDAYKKAAIFDSAWETAKMNAIFMNENYKDSIKRIEQIKNYIRSNKPLAKMSDSDLQVLLQPERIFNEIEFLRAEIESQKDILPPNEIKKKQAKLEAIENFSEAYDYYQRYEVFDRERVFEKAKESGIIENFAKENEISEEEAEEIVRQTIDNDLKVKAKNKENTLEAESKLEEAYKKYLQAIANQTGDIYLDENAEKAFEMLLDSYKLGAEASVLASNVNILRTPKEFISHVERNYDWMTKLYQNRKQYFDNLVNQEINNIELNALLNELADKNIYISVDDAYEFQTLGRIPNEFFDNNRKAVIRRGHPEYEAYTEIFKKVISARKYDLEVKDEDVPGLKADVAKLVLELQEEIENLPKIETRKDLGFIEIKNGKKTFSASEAIEQLGKNEYLELSISKESEPLELSLILFKDSNDDVYLDNADGELIDVRKLKDKYVQGKRFTIEMLPDPEEVERITNIYNEKIEEVYKKYISEDDTMDLEIPYEEITQDSNLNTPDLIDFRDKLYSKYEEEYLSTLSPEEQNKLTEDPKLNAKTFEEWYSKPENKKYFDEYNDENRPVISEKETILTINGNKVNTKNRTLEQLIEARDSLANKLTIENQNFELLDDESEKEDKKQAEKLINKLKLDLKNLNAIIAARQFARYPESMKDAIKSIQKLFKAQGKVERVTLTEDDELTGLKKGQTAYKINGFIHRRMTQAMQDVIDEKYVYKGQKDLDTIFDQTIAKKGLNPKSAKEFIERLKIFSKAEENNLPGTNDIFFNKLLDELLLLPNLTANQIKLEKEKVKILDKADKETDSVKKEALYEKALEIQNKIDEVTTTPVTDRDDIEKRYNEEITIALNKEINDSFTPVKVGPKNESRSAEEAILDATNFLKETFNWPQVEINFNSEEDSFTFIVNGTEFKINGSIGLSTVNGVTTASVPFRLKDIVNEKYQAELDALEDTAQPTTKDNFDTATKKNTTKDIINSFFAENSYEDSRVAGNFFDLAKDYLESGKKPELNEKIITKEAYDDLIEYLDTIKEKVDSGELYIVGRDLVVYDSDIDHGDGRRDRIAGEIDLVMVDREGGIYVVDIKSGESKKFLNFNKQSDKKKVYSKRNEYTLQTAGYATMLERNIDRPVSGLAMLPVERESNKETNQVLSSGAPVRGNMYNEIVYKKDDKGKILINKNLDPETGKPFDEKVFEQTKNKYKFDFLVPLYRESVQEEIDKLFGKKEGVFVPGAKRALSSKYNLFREKLNEITDEETKTNIDKIKRIERLINQAIEKDKINIPEDIANLLEQKKKTLRVYMGKETIKSIIKTYKNNLSASEKNLKRQKENLEKIITDVSFDDIDKSILEDDSDFINEQREQDKNFNKIFLKHEQFKDKIGDATLNQISAVQAMKASKLLTDEDIEDDFIDELSTADASELIHEGVKRIQFLKTETTDPAANKFKDYQKQIYFLMGAAKINTNDLDILENLQDAEFNAEEGLIDVAYQQLNKKIQNLESEANLEYTKEQRKEVISNEINDIKRFMEALALTYEIPFDTFENIVEGEVIVDEYDNEIKKGDEVYSRSSSDITIYKVKKVTSKNIILEDEKGKEIKVEIGKFDEQYITKSEMNAGEITPPGYNPTEGEKSIIEQSQMSVDDFLRNADDDKAKAHQEGISNTPAQNRKNLLDITKDCQ